MCFCVHLNICFCVYTQSLHTPAEGRGTSARYWWLDPFKLAFRQINSICGAGAALLAPLPSFICCLSPTFLT